MLDTRRYFPILAILSAILIVAPLRTGDLTGYDDAQYAHMAKDILRTGDWLVLRSNGEPALENSPLAGGAADVAAIPTPSPAHD